MATSLRSPVLPSMMVMVLVAAGGAVVGPGVGRAATAASGLTATTFGGPCPSAVFAAGPGCRLIGTTTIGSPPNGLLPTTAQTTNTPRNSVSTAAMTCDVVIGIDSRRLRSCWPSGAFRSSAIMVRSHVPAPFCRANRSRIMRRSLSRPVYCRFGPRLPAFRRFQDLPPKTKKDRKKFGAAYHRPEFNLMNWTAYLVRNRGLRIRREGGVGRGAAQEVERHFQRRVVLLIRRHVGLRAGLFAALGLEVAAQRRFALGVGPRFEVVRHVLQHLDVGRDALGLDRAARRREVARRGQLLHDTATTE